MLVDGASVLVASGCDVVDDEGSGTDVDVVEIGPSASTGTVVASSSAAMDAAAKNPIR